jgi:uncharacterized SAM-binding protein YcdF (DUF218 family)
MREFLSVLINPIPLLCLILVAVFILFRLNLRKAGKISLFISGIWFLIIITPFVPNILVRSLESRYAQLSDSAIRHFSGSYDIIVLGGGHSDDMNLSPNSQLSLIALSRLIEGIRLHRLIPASRLILSGNSKRSAQTEAIVYYKTAMNLGVDSSGLALQPLPLNTQQEAEEYVKNFGNKKNLILVTSAIHMPRAIMQFKNAGINPIAAPADFILKYEKNEQPLKWMPSSDNILMMEAAIHEYVGIIWAKLLRK